MFTTLIALAALYFFGGEVIKGFSFAMIWGVIAGTYSSIFIAVPLLVYMNLRRTGLIVGEETEDAPTGNCRPGMNDITAAAPSGRQFIQGYGAHNFRIAGEIHHGSVIIFPKRRSRGISHPMTTLLRLLSPLWPMPPMTSKFCLSVAVCRWECRAPTFATI